MNILNFIFPSHCLYCDKIISKKSLFCPKCWVDLRFIQEPKCEICSYPFEFDPKELEDTSKICIKCQKNRPNYDKIITIFKYCDKIKKIVLNAKFNDQAFILNKLSQIIIPSLAQYQNEFDLIISVPLHKKRLLKRKYNQAAILAKIIAKALNKPIYNDLLIKIKDTKPQSLSTKKARQENLKNSFRVKEKYKFLIENKNILLVDDITTTGATMNFCSKELKKNNCKKVVGFCLAKV